MQFRLRLVIGSGNEENEVDAWVSGGLGGMCIIFFFLFLIYKADSLEQQQQQTKMYWTE